MSWFKATTTQTIMMCVCCVFHHMIIYCNIINKGSNRTKCFLQTRCLIFIKYNVSLSSFLFSRLSCILCIGKNKKLFGINHSLHQNCMTTIFCFFFLYLLYTQLHHQCICPWQITIFVFYQMSQSLSEVFWNKERAFYRDLIWLWFN